ncbi:MAG: sigma-70 family RNA polymerase sigma factor [Heliobacteriaceae bacterium]|nr:sigma-70 family RNA polymerase sigma factor [Heliobacteriaceae bacterium]MDD4587164.1 sigma-70 family RNA polymerase sigma factor [Heliobacteriaceae bacterium]
MNVASVEEKVNRELFTDVYNTYFRLLYNYIHFRVGETHVTEDLVSEVFTKAMEKYHTYNPERGKLQTWLFAIAHNVVINYYQKNSYINKKITRLDVEGTEFRPEDVILDQERKQILLRAVMCLDERKRSIIALKFGARLTNRQIAKISEMTESNVGTILYRALKELKKILDEQGVSK